MNVQIVEAKYSDFTVKRTVILRNMEVSETHAVKLEGNPVHLRTAVSRVKAEFPGREYSTKEIEGGILVWRLA